jgi:hypothetical protein
MTSCSLLGRVSISILEDCVLHPQSPDLVRESLALAISSLMATVFSE